MKKLFYFFSLMQFVYLLASCSNSIETTASDGILELSDSDKQKIESLKNLFEEHGWARITTVSEEEFNKKLLDMDYEQTKDFLELMDGKGEMEGGMITSDKLLEQESLQSKITPRMDLTTIIYGSHKSYFATSQTQMYLQYDYPNPSYVKIVRTEVLSNPATRWTPDEYGTFQFNKENKCDLSVTGLIEYGGIYKHRYIMSGWVTKYEYGGISDGKIENFHSIN